MQANGGAKNYIVIMPDAEMNKAVENLATAAFGCAGERCSGLLTALKPVGKAAEKLLPSLIGGRRRGHQLLLGRRIGLLSQTWDP